MSPHAPDALLVLRLLSILREERFGVDADEVAKKFDLSHDQLSGLVSELWTYEFFDTDGQVIPERAIDFDAAGLEDGWLQLTRDPFGSIPVQLDPLELALITGGLEVLHDAAAAQLAETIAELLTKLHATPPPAEVSDAPNDGILDTVRAALDTGTQLNLEYIAEDAPGPSWRLVDPLRLEHEGDTTYLHAYCYRRQDTRWFRLDRIRAILPLDTPIAEYLPHVRAETLRGRGEHTANVAIHPLALTALRPYLGDRRLPAPEADGFIRTHMSFHSERIAARLAAAHAGHFIVEGPAEFRCAVATWLRQALNRQQAASSTAAA